MPIYTLRIGDRSFSINARGKRGALVLARSMITEETDGADVVAGFEGDGSGGVAIYAATVDAMMAGNVGRVLPAR